MFGLGLLIVGKVIQTKLQKRFMEHFQVLNVQVPFLFKGIVDALNVPITADTTVWVVAGSLIAGCKSFRYSTLSFQSMTATAPHLAQMVLPEWAQRCPLNFSMPSSPVSVSPPCAG